MVEQIAPELVDRCVALVTAMAVSADRLMTSHETRMFYEEAVDLWKFLPKPVDPDVLAARDIALKFALPARLEGTATKKVKTGLADESDAVQAVLTAIKYGKTLARTDQEPAHG